MNIQFMTKENNGVPSGEYDWKNEEKYVYVPNFDEMIKNASCEEEVKAIEDVRDMIVNKKIFNGFTFQIVFTIYTFVHDYETNKYEKQWTVYQHPWYESLNGVKVSKEEMTREIEQIIAKG